MNNNEKLDLIIEELYKIKQNQNYLKNKIKSIMSILENLNDDIEYIKIDLKNKF
jgi:hypothetical protein